MGWMGLFSVKPAHSGHPVAVLTGAPCPQSQSATCRMGAAPRSAVAPPESSKGLFRYNSFERVASMLASRV